MQKIIPLSELKNMSEAELRVNFRKLAAQLANVEQHTKEYLLLLMSMQNIQVAIFQHRKNALKR